MAEGTLIAIVLDRSGSMTSCRADAEEGINGFIESQAAIPGKCLVTLAKFDNKYELDFQGVPVTDVKKISLEPRGATALLDAVGKTVSLVAADLAGLPDEQKPERVLFVIVTDGHENASVEWRRDAVKQLVEQKQGEGWDFTFIGANIDAFAESATVGMRFAATLQTTPDSMLQGYASLDSAVSRSRLTNTALSYTEDERAAAAGKTETRSKVGA